MKVNGTPLPPPKIKSKTIEKVDPESFNHFPDYDSIFPLTRATWTRYVQFLIKEDECGVSTPESARAGIKWVAKMIGFPVFVNSPIAQGMIDNHFLEHGAATRKAAPLSLEVIKTLEAAVCNEDLPTPLRFTSFWILMLTFGTLRSDDGLHSCPDRYELHEQFLGGEAWRTKVDRKGRGTKFAVARVTLTEHDWVAAGFKIMQEDALLYDPQHRDYLMDTPIKGLT